MWTKQLKKVVKCNQCSVAKQLPKPSEMRINTFASLKTETDICWWTLSLFTYAALWTASSELNRKWIPERIYRDQGEDIRWVVALYWNLNKQHLLILGHQWSHRYLQGVSLSVSWHSSSGHGNSETSLNSQITILFLCLSFVCLWNTTGEDFEGTVHLLLGLWFFVRLGEHAVGLCRAFPLIAGFQKWRFSFLRRCLIKWHHWLANQMHAVCWCHIISDRSELRPSRC